MTKEEKKEFLAELLKVIVFEKKIYLKNSDNFPFALIGGNYRLDSGNIKRIVGI